MGKEKLHFNILIVLLFDLVIYYLIILIEN